jgi:hypothetical protein
VGREERVKREQIELAQAFGFEKRFLDGKYHQTDSGDLALKRKLAVEAIRTGRTLEQELRYELRELGKSGLKLPLTAHGLSQLGDLIRWGSMTGCKFAIGFRTVWGQRRGPQIA